MSCKAYEIFSAAWQKQVTRTKGLTAAEVRERTPTDSALVCPIDNKLFRDAVKTPCCGTLYCEECIQTHLLERDFLCPSCGKKIASLDKVVMDKPTRTKVLDYIDRIIEDSKKEGEEENGSATGSAPVGEVSMFLLCAIKYLSCSSRNPTHRTSMGPIRSFTQSNNQAAIWTCPR